MKSRFRKDFDVKNAPMQEESELAMIESLLVLKALIKSLIGLRL
jgi:hypothetical protein